MASRLACTIESQHVTPEQMRRLVHVLLDGGIPFTTDDRGGVTFAASRAGDVVASMLGGFIDEEPSE